MGCCSIQCREVCNELVIRYQDNDTTKKYCAIIAASILPVISQFCAICLFQLACDSRRAAASRAATVIQGLLLFLGLGFLLVLIVYSVILIRKIFGCETKK